MSDEQKFEALKQQILTRHEQVYGKEAREKYGDDMVDAAQSAIRNLTVEQYREWTQLGQQIQARLEAAVRAGLSPEGEDGQDITAPPPPLAHHHREPVRPGQAPGDRGALCGRPQVHGLLRQDGTRLCPV